VGCAGARLSGWDAVFAVVGNLLVSVWSFSFLGGGIREFVRLRRVPVKDE
jgi:hypothetical protein